MEGGCGPVFRECTSFEVWDHIKVGLKFIVNFEFCIRSDFIALARFFSSFCLEGRHS